jgi:hypothetical protein
MEFSSLPNHAAERIISNENGMAGILSTLQAPPTIFVIYGLGIRRARPFVFLRSIPLTS